MLRNEAEYDAAIAIATSVAFGATSLSFRIVIRGLRSMT
jgi:hypothetical protein